MPICPHCYANVAEYFANRKCPKCGKTLKRADDTGATLDTNEHFEQPSGSGTLAPSMGIGEGTVDLPAPVDMPIPNAVPPSPAVQGSLSTVDMPALQNQNMNFDVGEDAVSSKPASAEQTVDVDADFEMDSVGTVDLPSVGPNDSASQQTVVAGGPGGTVPYGTERPGFLETVAPSDGEAEDAESTVDSTDSKSAGSAGDTGKLRQMWEGAAGSSGNPMHSLKSEGKVTGSVFAKIAKRTLVEDPNAKDDTADYQLLKKLGEGAMGVVYSARQRAINRTVAIKAIKPKSSKENDAREKFFYEAQITGDLDHPNIVPIHELGANDNGTLFYSMKLVSGTPWQDVLRKKTREENIDILLRVCDGVGFAHSRKVIHRDLKPENIMLGDYGEVLVMDWGLAVDLKQGRKFGLGGTPAYMAPEMARHEMAKIGPKSDIYVLGAMLYQVITGHPPHPGKTVTQCLMAASHNEILPYDKADTLLDIAMKAMATSLDDRYESVEKFQEAIRLYRRHAESITLSTRSEQQLAEAEKNRDYQAFSRAIFGFKDAIELWSENKAAIAGLPKARLSYGQCAFARGDYDLCLQTLERSVPAEAKLYDEAAKAKEVAANRESRFRSLRRTFVGVVSVALIGMSGLAYFANTKRVEAVQAKDDLNVSLEAQKELTKAEATAKATAVKNEEIATKAKNDAVKAQEATAEALRKENVAKLAAIEAQKEEKKAKDDAEDKRKDAVVAQKAAEDAKALEEIAKKAASQNAFFAQLGDYQSTLSLALTQSQTAQVSRSVSLLDGINNEVRNGLIGLTDSKKIPLLNNWAFRRIELLNNKDLPKSELGKGIVEIAVASAASRAVVASNDPEGKLQLVELGRDVVDIEENKNATIPGKIMSVAISPDGKEVMVSTQLDNEKGALYRWAISGEAVAAPVAIEATKSRLLPAVAFSPDGKWFVTGVNGGVWAWDRSSGSYGEANAVKFLLKGANPSFQFASAADVLYVISKQDVTTLNQVNLAEGKVGDNVVAAAPYQLPRDTTAAAVVSEGEKPLILVGTVRGDILLYQGEAPEEKGKEATLTFVDRFVAKHFAAVTALSLAKDGVILSGSDEQVVHVWRPRVDAEGKNVQGRWDYARSLIGLPGNVADSSFVGDSNHVVGVGRDAKGTAMVWDIPRQDARERTVIRNPAAIRAVAAHTLSYSVGTELAAADEIAGAVDVNGVMRRWSTVTGPKSVESYDFFGHTPHAVFADLAFDLNSQTLITVATLGNNCQPYLGEDAQKNVEFCQWDLNSGIMLRRWRDSIKGEPVVGLAAQGKILVVGADKTLFYELADVKKGPTVLDDLPSRLISVHPTNSDLVALVDPRGKLTITSASKPSAENFSRELSFTNEAQTPTVELAWSPSGNRIYVLQKTGEFGVFGWDDKAISLLSKLPADASVETKNAIANLEKEIQSNGVGFASRVVDISIDADGAKDVVNVLIRPLSTKDEKGNINSAKKVEFAWDAQGLMAGSVKNEVVSADQYLVRNGVGTSSAATKVSDLGFRNLVDVVPTSNGFFAVTEHRGLQENGTANYFLVSQWNQGGEGLVQRVGRPHCTSASPAQGVNGSVANWVVSLGQRTVWLTQYGDTAGVTSKPINHGLAVVTDTVTSPDGKYSAIIGTKENAPVVNLMDLATMTSVGELPGVTQLAWHPASTTAEFATLNGDGSLSLYAGVADLSQKREISASQPGVKTAALDFFREVLVGEDGSTESVWHLLAQRQPIDAGAASEQSYEIEFLPIAGASDKKFSLKTNAQISAMRASPTENILVLGDKQGSVVLYFASPTVDKEPHELYSLSGHLGQEISDINFTSDGETILTSDKLGQQYGWMAKDKSEVNVQKKGDGELALAK